MDISITHYLLLSALLFCIGLMVVLTRKNTIVILMGIELMLNASMINLVGFARQDPALMAGQIFSLFIIVIAAASAAVGLALVLNAYDRFGTVNLDEIKNLKN
jgi:NADH-quinone oxidoreductase subunit K